MLKIKLFDTVRLLQHFMTICWGAIKTRILLAASILSLVFFPFCLHAGQTDLSLTPDEIEWLKAHPVIKISINNGPPPISIWDNDEFTTPPGDVDYPPFPESHPDNPPQGEAVPGMIPPVIRVSNQNNMFIGVAADYLKEIGKLIGVSFNVVMVTNHRHDIAIDAMNRQEIDMVLPIILEQSAIPSIHVTDPFVEVPLVIVTRTDVEYIDDPIILESMRVAGVMPVKKIIEQMGFDVDLQHMSPVSGLPAVATGRIDAFIADLSHISHLLSNKPIQGIKISGELPFASKYTFAVGSHVSVLENILNKAIKALPREKKNKIWRQWFSITYEKKLTASPLARVIGIAVIIALVFALLMSLYLFRRFQKIKTAVAALDPHLLSVHIDDNITITEVTEALCKATGFANQDLVGKSLVELGKPVMEQAGSLEKILNSIQKGNLWKGEVKIVRKDGTSMWAEAVISPLRRKKEKASGYAVIYQDVSERKHLETLATRDELTELYNRRYYNEVAPVLFNRARREKLIYALFLLDVDNFKKYNDTYGHPAGDTVLASIGKELRRIFKRRDDMTFRLGGEEFGALLIVSSLGDAEKIAEEVLTGIRLLQIEHEKNAPGIVTVSIGVKTVSAGESEDIKSVYQKADLALYKAKQGGRDRYIVSGE